MTSDLATPLITPEEHARLRQVLFLGLARQPLPVPRSD
jgi:hypothetical protein